MITKTFKMTCEHPPSQVEIEHLVEIIHEQTEPGFIGLTIKTESGKCKTCNKWAMVVTKNNRYD